MTSREEMMTCPLTGNTHIWTLPPPTEGIHPRDGKSYVWLMGKCGCGMMMMLEKEIAPAEKDWTGPIA